MPKNSETGNRVVKFSEEEGHSLGNSPAQKFEASFMSSHIPSKSTSDLS